jgi:iron complex transport system substrate-binding protein
VAGLALAISFARASPDVSARAHRLRHRRDRREADIVAELIRARIAVHAFNQRDIAGILAMIHAWRFGRRFRAWRCVPGELSARIERVRQRAAQLSRNPRVYFEEWDEPMISGIGWVSELIEIADGIDVFSNLSAQKSAKDRFVSGEQVVATQPDIVIGSWCGKKFVRARVAARPGFAEIPAGKSAGCARSNPRSFRSPVPPR